MFSSYILFIIGVGVIFLSLILIKKETNKSQKNHEYLLEKEEELRNNIVVADDIINELSDMGEGIIYTLNEKIKEVNELINYLEKYHSNEFLKPVCTKSNEEEKQELSSEVNHDINNSQMSNKDIKRIIEMKNKGYKSSQIAKVVNRGIGEIDLIVNLKRGEI